MTVYLNLLAHSVETEYNNKMAQIKTIDELIEKVVAYHPKADIQLLRRAYEFSEKAHSGQIRRSGEPYISHPLQVAEILADLRLDLDSIITGLLHDTVEDTAVTLEDVKREFGETVMQLVDGVTKISQMKFKNSHEKQGENVRKMIVAMGKDVRVLLVKLGDRLHNMRTLNFMPFEKQEKIALETLDIYCPLAGRLGIMKLKVELEDLCFRYYRPDTYYELVQKIKKTETETNRYIEEVKRMIHQELSKAGFKHEVFGRSKHLWSIYRKMNNRNIEYEQVYDVLAFRVIVESLSDCYAALGLIHSLWKPIPGRFKDFIAIPKTNNYQSLHTTVVGPGGERIEIQIRTQEMHLIAEQGIAAHWSYKEGKQAAQSLNQINWLRELVSWHQQVGNSEEFLDNLKTDLFENEIYVFTPKGDVREFPDGATPVDFAYAVHTQLGHTCVGAKVNGKMVPLKYKLQNGDSIDIVSSKNQTPSKDWLKFVVTNRAKSKIRQFVKEEQHRRSMSLGKELLEKEFRKFGMAAAKYLKGDIFDKFVKDNGFHNLDELLVRVGYGKVEPKFVVDRLTPEADRKLVEPKESTFMEKVLKAAAQKVKKTNSLIAVDGMDDVLVHYAKCCHPIPGDGIVGFISRGRGVSIHRSDCPRAFEIDQARRVDVNWTGKEAPTLGDRQVKIKVVAQDEQGLLKKLGEAFSAQGMNIESVNIRTNRDRKAICLFDVSVRNTEQVVQAIYELQKIRGIISVERL